MASSDAQCRRKTARTGRSIMHGLHARVRVQAYYAPIAAYISALKHRRTPSLRCCMPWIRPSNRIVATAAPHREFPGPHPIFCHELITERALASRNMHRAQADAHAPTTCRLMAMTSLAFPHLLYQRLGQGASRRLPPLCVPESSPSTEAERYSRIMDVQTQA